MDEKLLLEAKVLVSAYHKKLSEKGGIFSIKKILPDYLDTQTIFDCSHPINRLTGIDEVYQGFWEPFIKAFPDVQRRDDIFLGGVFKEGYWISSTGYFAGNFENDWLDIPATKTLAYVRFGEFNKVENGKITETIIIIDFLDLMRQAGVKVLADSLGYEGLVPAPSNQKGLMSEIQNREESKGTLSLVEDMLSGLMTYDESGELGSMGQNRFWDEKMMWYGPSGIGTTRGLDGFEKYHQRSFLKAFPDRVGGNHRSRIGDGMFAASTGWPSINATHAGGGWLMMPATNKKITMRVMDWWRREDDKLVENWVLIDIIECLNQFGVDLFARMREMLQK